jgi:hypothetical protein
LAIYTNNIIRRGILTGFNEAFIIDQATRDLLIAEDASSTEIVKPFLVGEDIKRYSIDFKERYLIFTRRGTDITKYKAIERYLARYRAELEPRPLNWNDKTQGQWPGRKPGPYKWYEIQDNIAYYADFEKPKIIYPDIAERCKFAFDPDSHYSINTTYMRPIEKSHHYLVALLNSSLIEFYYRTISASIRGGYLRFFSQYVNLIPIRRINFVTSESERAYYRDKARLLYQQCLQEQGKPDCVLGFVNHHLTRQPEASDVVHDLLAFLAEMMLDLNRQKRTLQKEFLSYLAATLRVRPDNGGRTGIETLSGKSRLLDYAGDYLKNEEPLSPDELWDIVRKNRGRLDVNLAQPGLKESVLDTYAQNLERIRPLQEQLRYTDALIDQVVYRLYGLTEEEIAIVEGL